MYSVSDLETFVAVAKHGGISPAARVLGISVATTSHRLAKIEQSLKVALFHRSNRSLKLSDEGARFLERIESILEDLQEAECAISGRSTQLRGHLRVTMSPWVLKQFIMPRLYQFKDAHPELTLEFNVTDRFVPLAEEMTDCAIRVGELTDSSMVGYKLAENKRVICASPDYIAREGVIDSLAKLQQSSWVCLPWQTKLSVKCGNKSNHSIQMAKKLIVSSSDMLTEGALHGSGLAIKSYLAIEDELANGSLVEVMPGSLCNDNAPISFLYPVGAKSVRKIQYFKEFVAEIFRAC